MDFHSLARKELQALCKKNKIPANITNVAMADALTALDEVEGLDDVVNAGRSQFQEETSNVESRSAVRTSTRRKPINVEPESSQLLTRTRRTTRRTSAEEVEQENINANLLETPAMPATRRRAPVASSARKRIDTQLLESCEDEKPEEDEKSDVPVETPAMQSSRKKALAVSTRKKMERPMDEKKSVQRTYGTRHSVRLLDKSLADLSLKEEMMVKVVKIEGLGEDYEQVEHKEDIPESNSLIDKSLDNGGEMTIDVHEEHKVNNDHHRSADSTKPEKGSENFTNPDDHFGEMIHLQIETSEKAANIIDESNCENGVVTTENSESVIAALERDVDEEAIANQEPTLEPEMEKKAIDKQVSDDSAPFVVDTENIAIVNAADEVSIEVGDLLIPEAQEVEGKVFVQVINASGFVGGSFEINLIEDEHHGSEEASDGNDIEEESDGYELDEFQYENYQEKSDYVENEYNGCDSDVSEAKDSPTVQDFSSSSDSDNTPRSVKQNIEFYPLASHHEIQPEEHAASAQESIQTLDKSSCASEKEAGGGMASSPFAANTIQGKFPRPTASTTPRKSSTKKQTSAKKKIIILAEIKKENIDNAERRVEPKKDKNKTNTIVIDKDISLRKLTKMLREKLQFKSNEGRNVSEVGTRQALQTLPENSIAAAEPEQKN